MHVIVSGYENLISGTGFPEWANLRAFAITGSEKQKDVEIHYHHYEEVWFWWKGKGAGWIEGAEYTMLPGVLSYAPPNRLHAIGQMGPRKNTLIVPKLPEGEKWGHLHLEETGETLTPDRNTILLMPEQTTPDTDYEFPEGTFMRSCWGGAFSGGESVLDRTAESWSALLVREGTFTGEVDGESIRLNPQQCLFLSEGSAVRLKAEGPADCAFVQGW